VDRIETGELDLTDIMALAAVVNKLNSRFGSSTNQQAQSVLKKLIQRIFENVSCIIYLVLRYSRFPDLLY